MTDERIKDLLQKADRMSPAFGGLPADLTMKVRRRAGQRRIRHIATPFALAAVALITFGIFHMTTKSSETASSQNRIASLEIELQQLQARTSATLQLLREVLERQENRRHLAELEARLASIDDPLEEVRSQKEETAFILVYQADRMYQELGLQESAVETYKRTVELFPSTRSAEVARKRLSEIQSSNTSQKLKI